MVKIEKVGVFFLYRLLLFPLLPLVARLGFPLTQILSPRAFPIGRGLLESD